MKDDKNKNVFLWVGSKGLKTDLTDDSLIKSNNLDAANRIDITSEIVSF